MKRRRGGSSKRNKISKLPDELIHHIFSFIDTKYAVQTCVLSKPWRYIWTSLPTLNFYHTSELYSNEQKFVNVINKVLEHRNNKLCNIRRFHVRNRWYLKIPLDTWITAAVKAKVQDIFIPYVGPQETEIPECLFTCKSLKRLILESQFGNLTNVPRYVCLPHLVYLKVDNIPFRHEDEVNRLISGCPALQHLNLMFRDLTWTWHKYNGLGNMDVKIHSLTLKHLKIYKGSGTITLDLYVPNLVSVPTFESAIVHDIKSEDFYRMSERKRLIL